MQRFKSPRQARRFLSAHGPIRQHFHPCRHRLSAADYRLTRVGAFQAWSEATCAQPLPDVLLASASLFAVRRLT